MTCHGYCHPLLSPPCHPWCFRGVTARVSAPITALTPHDLVPLPLLFLAATLTWRYSYPSVTAVIRNDVAVEVFRVVLE
jgi:hypothetical protein